MRTLDLDVLLGEKHEHATFHDSELESYSIDFLSSTVRLAFRIPCGFEANRELSYQRGILEFEEICFYFVEPAIYNKAANDTSTLWITSDGSLPDSGVDIDVQLPSDLPEDAFAHYFYSSTTNSFIVVAAKRAVFYWNE
jgi:hypothetical protein